MEPGTRRVIFTRAGVPRGARTRLPLWIGMAPFGLVIGVLAEAKGFSFAEQCLMSALVYAGAALAAWLDRLRGWKLRATPATLGDHSRALSVQEQRRGGGGRDATPHPRHGARDRRRRGRGVGRAGAAAPTLLDPGPPPSAYGAHDAPAARSRPNYAPGPRLRAGPEPHPADTAAP